MAFSAVELARAGGASVLIICEARKEKKHIYRETIQRGSGCRESKLCEAAVESQS